MNQFPSSGWSQTGFPFTSNGQGFPIIPRKHLSDAIILALFANNEQGGYYDPYDLTEEKLGWRRNLLLWSNTFTNDYWDKLEVSVTVTDVPAPNGGFATKVTKLSGNVIRLQRNNTGANGQVRSIWARSVSGTGTVAMLGFHGIAKYVRTLTTEWQRFEAPVDTSETGGAFFYVVDFRTSTLNEVLIADAQLEVGSTATEVQRITNFHNDFMEAFPNHTLFQDSLGTIPVTGHMQPVGRVLDKSGNGIPALAPLSSARPIMQKFEGLNWQYFDGVDDRLTTIPSNTLKIPFTMAVRFVPDEVSDSNLGRYRVVARGSDASTRGAISVDNGNIFINLDGAVGISVTSVSTGADVTVVCRFLANGTSVVVNGQEYNYTSFVSQAANTTPISIGSQTGGSNRLFRGLIGRVVLIDADIGADKALELNNFMRSEL